MSTIEEILLKKLRQQYALTEEVFNIILRKIIKRYTYGTTPVDSPALIILGAQPGAGKTELQKEAELKLFKNAVICNADNFRDFHPSALEIKKNHPIQYPDITAEYAQRWNDELCKHCLANHLNYILETTFRSGDQLNETIKTARLNGYWIEIHLLAVNARLSRLGIHYRYEQMLAATGFGRRVSRRDHDLRFDAIPYALKKVQDAQLYDDIRIYGRTVVIEGASKVDGVNLIAHNPQNPLAIYKGEIDRLWPDKLKLYFGEKCDEVLNLMKNRNAPVKEIDEFRNDVGLKKSQKQGLSKRRGMRP